MNYKQPTDAILLHGTDEDIAVVTYIDSNKKLAAIVYGYKQRRMVKLSNLPPEGKSRINHKAILADRE